MDVNFKNQSETRPVHKFPNTFLATQCTKQRPINPSQLSSARRKPPSTLFSPFLHLRTALVTDATTRDVRSFSSASFSPFYLYGLAWVAKCSTTPLWSGLGPALGTPMGAQRWSGDRSTHTSYREKGYSKIASSPKSNGLDRGARDCLEVSEWVHSFPLGSAALA